jgi:pilus assembly protein FimV
VAEGGGDGPRAESRQSPLPARRGTGRGAGLGAGWRPRSTGVDDNSLDFDLDLGEGGAELTSQEPPLDEMDFDLDTGTGEEPKPAAPEAEALDFDLGGEEERKPEAMESNDLDFDLGDLDLGGAGADLEAEEEPAEGLLSDMDEVATKLDLARAYVDMGDPDGARSILEEVLQEGSEAQQDEARELLGQL